MAGSRVSQIVLVAVMALLALALWIRGPDSERPSSAVRVQSEEVRLPAPLELAGRPVATKPVVAQPADSAEAVQPYIVVLDADGGRPLPGVRGAILGRNGSTADLGESNDDGRIELGTHAAPPRWISCRKQGFESTLMVLPVAEASRDPDRPVLTIRLRRGARLSGRVVVMPDRHAPRSPLTVLALPAADPRRADEVAAAVLRGDAADVPSVRTDGTGAFSLDELAPETLYTLSVGGDGYVMRDSQLRVRPQGVELEIPVYPLYVAELQVETTDGGPLPDFSPMHPDPPPGWRLNGDLSIFGDDHAATAFAALAGAAGALDTVPFGGRIWGTASVDADKIGPFSTYVRYPNCEPVLASVWAFRASSTERRVNRVRLRSLGTIRYSAVSIGVDVAGIDPDILAASDDVERPDKFAVMRLIMQDPLPGDIPSFVIPIARPTAQRLLLERVPVGVYKATILPMWGIGFEPPLTAGFEVREGRVTEFTFAPSGWGAVEFSLPTDAARPIEPASVTMTWHDPRPPNPGPRETTVTVHARKPLRIDGVAARQYSVQWTWGGRRSEPVVLEVTPGRLVKLAIPEPGRK